MQIFLKEDIVVKLNIFKIYKVLMMMNKMRIKHSKSYLDNWFQLLLLHCFDPFIRGRI